MIISPAGTIAVTQAQIAAGNVIVKANSGMLCMVLVTTVTAAAALTLFDNSTTASGTVVGVIPIGTAAGTIFAYNIPCINGIVIGQQAAFTGGITVVIG